MATAWHRAGREDDSRGLNNRLAVDRAFAQRLLPDVIVLDMMMSNMVGEEFARE
jgi:CheY-like chemotaxis protein